MLDLMLERVRRARGLDEIVVATTTMEPDDEIASVAGARGAMVFRGSEEDVLSRYVGAAAFAEAEVVVRLTADCPLIDPAVIERVLGVYRTLQAPAGLVRPTDLVTNTPPHGRTYPDGMDVEVFAVEGLARADAAAVAEAQDREHVTRRFHRLPFRVAVVDLDPPAGDVRITVDDPEDLERVRAIFEDLYPGNSVFDLRDILAWLDVPAQVRPGPR